MSKQLFAQEKTPPIDPRNDSALSPLVSQYMAWGYAGKQA